MVEGVIPYTTGKVAQIMGFLDSINVIDILGFGIIGLGFLLALMAYRLLAREQGRARTRKNMLRAVYIFMAFSVVLIIIGFASESLGDDSSSIEQPPDSTPDVTATVKAAVATALASQPTSSIPDVTATVTAAVATALASQPTSSIPDVTATVTAAVATALASQPTPTVIPVPTPTVPSITPPPFTTISELRTKIIKAEDYSLYVGQGSENTLIVAAIEQSLGPSILGVDLTISEDEPTVIVKEGVRVRNVPGSNFEHFHPPLGELKPGQSFRITGRNEGGDWWRIECPQNVEPLQPGECWVWRGHAEYDATRDRYIRDAMDSINVAGEILVVHD
jgi:hypothetical protein